MNHIYLDVLPRSFNIQTTDCTMVQEDHLWYTFLQLNPLSSKSHTDTVEGCFILFSVTILCWYIADDKCERCYWTRKFTTIGDRRKISWSTQPSQLQVFAIPSQCKIKPQFWGQLLYARGTSYRTRTEAYFRLLWKRRAWHFCIPLSWQLLLGI